MSLVTFFKILFISCSSIKYFDLLDAVNCQWNVNGSEKSLSSQEVASKYESKSMHFYLSTTINPIFSSIPHGTGFCDHILHWLTDRKQALNNNYKQSTFHPWLTIQYMTMTKIITISHSHVVTCLILIWLPHSTLNATLLISERRAPCPRSGFSLQDVQKIIMQQKSTKIMCWESLIHGSKEMSLIYCGIFYR